MCVKYYKKLVKKFVPALLIALLPFYLNCQSISNKVISSTGGFAVNNDFNFSFTVGEMTMVQTFFVGNNILTQGFQQPEDNIAGLIDLDQNKSGSLIVYPNPAIDNFYFGFLFPCPGKVSGLLFNDVGQKIAVVYTGHYETGRIVGQTNISNLAGGMYLFVLSITPDNGGAEYNLTREMQIIN
jgi:hypothetical protein